MGDSYVREICPRLVLVILICFISGVTNIFVNNMFGHMLLTKSVIQRDI